MSLNCCPDKTYFLTNPSKLYLKHMQPHRMIRGHTDETVCPRAFELLRLEAALDFLMSWNQTVNEWWLKLWMLCYALTASTHSLSLGTIKKCGNWVEISSISSSISALYLPPNTLRSRKLLELQTPPITATCLDPVKKPDGGLSKKQTKDKNSWEWDYSQQCAI